MIFRTTVCAAVIAASLSAPSSPAVAEVDKDTLTKAADVVYWLRYWDAKFAEDQEHYHVLDSSFNDCVKHIKPLYKTDKGARITLDDKSRITVEKAWLECIEVARKLDKYDRAKKAAANAKLDKKLAPYKKVLRGEKLSFFVNNKLWEIDLFGRKGVRLSSPAALQASSVWFVVVNYKDAGETWWELRRYAFKGNDYKGATESRGKGMNPPSKAFR